MASNGAWSSGRAREAVAVEVEVGDALRERGEREARGLALERLAARAAAQTERRQDRGARDERDRTQAGRARRGGQRDAARRRARPGSRAARARAGARRRSSPPITRRDRQQVVAALREPLDRRAARDREQETRIEQVTDVARELVAEVDERERRRRARPARPPRAPARGESRRRASSGSTTAHENSTSVRSKTSDAARNRPKRSGVRSGSATRKPPLNRSVARPINRASTVVSSTAQAPSSDPPRPAPRARRCERADHEYTPSAAPAGGNAAAVRFRQNSAEADSAPRRRLGARGRERDGCRRGADSRLDRDARPRIAVIDWPLRVRGGARARGGLRRALAVGW